MSIALFLPSYFIWHYTKALREMFGVTTNFIWFSYHFFSIEILLRSFFSPWRRLSEKRSRGFDPANFFSSLIVNLLMRAVGIVMRTIVLVMGFVACLGVIAIGIVFFALWLLLPAVLLVLLLSAWYFWVS